VKGLQLVGLISPRPNRNEYHCFGLNTARKYGGPFGQFYAGGTGEASFSSTLEACVDGIDAMRAFFAGRQQLGACFGSVLLANLLGNEARTGRNLLERWGGGFEVATIIDARFQKLTGVLHTFWEFSKSRSGQLEIKLMPVFQKLDYWNDVLVIRTLELERDQKSPRVKRDNVHRVFPLLKGPEKYDMSAFRIPDFSHTTLCCYICSIGIEPDPGVLSYVDYNPSGNDKIRIDLNGKESSVAFGDELVQSIISAISVRTA
jgi:hypothetical protein